MSANYSPTQQGRTWASYALATATKRYSNRIPIVLMFALDPVARGQANSLRRPGGSVDGLLNMVDDIRLKFFQLARLLVPKARHFAGLYLDLGGISKAARDAKLELGR